MSESDKNLIDTDAYNGKFAVNSKAKNTLNSAQLIELLEGTNIEFQLSDPKSSVSEKALEHALDIRKFEIDLYWKRATYFWTFIGATLAGFFAIQASSDLNSIIKQDLSVILSCLGIIFSFAWVCVNEGSKYWQTNWEKHVDALEDESIGPLYKMIMPCDKSMLPPMSVSKVNKLVSIYVFILWILLLVYSLLPTLSIDNTANWKHVIIIVITVISCISFLCFGRSSSANTNENYAKLREKWNKKIKKEGRKCST